MQCSTSLSEALNSTTFQFLVGSERKAFNVHSMLVVQLSPVFAALINGKMVESIERRAVLDDIDQETFLRFCEYAYKGDFSVPPPTTVVRQKLSSSMPLETINDKFTPDHQEHLSTGAQVGKEDGSGEGDEGLITLAKDLRPPVHHNHCKPAWKQRIYRPVSWLRGARVHRDSGLHATDPQINIPVTSNIPEPGSKLAMDWARFCSVASDWKGPIFHPYRNCPPSESLTETLLSQARLYVFADRYVVESLKALVLYKMRRTLASLKLFFERVPEVFGLVQYVYENTREGDDLRLLLTQFAACVIPVLLQHPDWDRFIREQRTFTWDLLQHLRESVEAVDCQERGLIT
ncbi:uncharacterized protein Z520_01539 [Fonsecaea multimorphosa CBS 102226]|uniref:BTB domain-containing protein n=1 Tax=Fonsecaea multimorphosa CBS 102226 TaxID=1442371 RepID=A0A0D2J119_9EURO|nr:uncharacterized protein Z520_01539 [Fonsecaea multimorphosa CBS 102226]KIY03072.1 hypothetical protein Z520_01539 [Fonsecaea multimorphosa CBS 102226]OAL30566.1 hypothetical protein AYO22_01518 [Fonsecaea multimorphosa]